MKFTIEKKLLEKVMSHAVGIIERKQTVPILGYVLMESSSVDNTIKITSTNMDLTIVDVVKAEVEQSGIYCVAANLLYDITKKMKNNSKITVSFDEAKGSVVIISNNSSFDIHYMNKDNFPPIIDATYDVKFLLNSEVLKKSINIAKVAMLQDNTRFHLNGINMHYENDLGVNKLRFVATDLFRISCVSVLAPNESQSMPSIIVSKKTVGEILKLIEDTAADEVCLSISDTRICFQLSDDSINTEFSSRLINGTFPEYKSALEVSNDKILLVNTEDFIDAIDRVSTVVMDSTNSIRLDIQSDKLILNGVSRELGSATEEVEASFNAFEPMTICFNGKYLMEILEKIETKEVKFLLAESSSSTIIEPSEKTGQDMLFAIMPIEVVKN
ncbi:MAG: DNA polymerase III subunit beta [Holosporales bacterium]|jgi:DNA polymerase-3 subunit beta|nr:DNA polymerase III subunit beta [Holosporales bacterium]